jgi:predicted 3-demethylubiquinone-9 3-methyltransferase (glyoxalase superfamily)
MQKITTFLMFDDQTDEAVNFYLATFKNAKLLSASRYGADGPGPAGTIMSATFQLEGQEFMAFNGGPHFSFSEGMSLFIRCQTQEEVDELWEKLSEGGEKQQCGWLKDRFGVSWQIIPTALMELMGDPDPEKSQRVVQAMLQMTKIDIEGLKRAYDGR